jgi:cytoskeletal protein CcmA (bactofilin family)
MSLIARLFGRSSTPSSVIAADTTVTGTLRGPGRLVVAGRVSGAVDTAAVDVAAGGRLDGQVTAERLRVAGEVTGTARVGHVLVVAEGRFSGHVLCDSLKIVAGAALDARCRVRRRPVLQVAETRRPAAAAGVSLPTATPARLVGS